MGKAYRGPYARPSSYNVPYITGVWGNGINPVHAQYGEGPPLNLLGREGSIGGSPVAGEHSRDREYQQASQSSSVELPSELSWGYPVDYSIDSFGSGADGSPWMSGPAIRQDMDDRPAWNEDPTSDRLRAHSTMTPWSRTGAKLRSIRQGARQYRLNPDGPITDQPSHQLPNETVTEGWENKVTSFVAYAHPSDPSQYEVQTSMRQRFGTRDNKRAVARGTDDDRSTIASRVVAMVRKQYSENERLYDMDPYQITDMPRPFRYRTAGTGRQDWMHANAVYPISPIQRVPPPDASVGVPEVDSSADYGYTGEDTMYYAG